MPVTLRTGMAISLLPYLRSRFETRRFAFFQSGRLPHRFASNLAWLAKYMMAKRFAMTKNKYHGERFRSSSRAQRGDIPVRTPSSAGRRAAISLFAHLRLRVAERPYPHGSPISWKQPGRLLQSLPLLRNDENYAIASVSVRHRERSAAICLSALFSHPERSKGSFCFPFLAWSPDHARQLTNRSPN